MSQLMNVRADGSQYDINFWMDVEEFTTTVDRYVALLQDEDTTKNEMTEFRDIVLEDVSDDLVRTFLSTVITILNCEILDGIMEAVLKQQPILLTIPGFCVTDFQDK